MHLRVFFRSDKSCWHFRGWLVVVTAPQFGEKENLHQLSHAIAINLHEENLNRKWAVSRSSPGQLRQFRIIFSSHELIDVDKMRKIVQHLPAPQIKHFPIRTASSLISDSQPTCCIKWSIRCLSKEELYRSQPVLFTQMLRRASREANFKRPTFYWTGFPVFSNSSLFNFLRTNESY